MMRRLSIGACGLLLAWSCAAGCRGSGDGGEDRPKAAPTAARPQADQPKAAPTAERPKIKADERKAVPTAAQIEDERRPVVLGPLQGEDLLSAQELTDRLLVVRARLDKPGPVPEYELGEPIVVALDIRNMTERHQFVVPYWGITSANTSHYVVEARRDGEPVPHTLLGRRSVELLRRNLPVQARYPVRPFNVLASQPTPANILVNVLCDMSDRGEYELVVKFRVAVMMVVVNGRRETVNAVKVVSPSPPLRLKVVNRRWKAQESWLYKLQPSRQVPGSSEMSSQNETLINPGLCAAACVVVRRVEPGVGSRE